MNRGLEEVRMPLPWGDASLAGMLLFVPLIGVALVLHGGAFLLETALYGVSGGVPTALRSYFGPAACLLGGLYGVFAIGRSYGSLPFERLARHTVAGPLIAAWAVVGVWVLPSYIAFGYPVGSAWVALAVFVGAVGIPATRFARHSIRRARLASGGTAVAAWAAQVALGVLVVPAAFVLLFTSVALVRGHLAAGPWAVGSSIVLALLLAAMMKMTGRLRGESPVASRGRRYAR